MKFVERLDKTVDSIARLDCYRPSSRVSELFSELVSLVKWGMDSKQEDLLIARYAHSTRIWASLAEAELEQFWAKKILKADNFWYAIKDFPYLENYWQLAFWENWRIEKKLGRRPQKLLFVGAGSLPLSVIFWAKLYGVEVVALDCDDKAVTLGSKLIQKAGVADKIDYRQENFMQFGGENDFDLIFLAAMALDDEGGKAGLLQQADRIMRPNQLLAARTVVGLKKLLYQEVNINHLKQGWKKTELLVPDVDVINSLILTQKC